MANIFIVDDEQDVVFLIERILTLSGHTIVAKAFNGRQAVDIYKKFKSYPDIVILDYKMPLLNGLEVAEILLKINLNCKIIFISADLGIKETILLRGLMFLEKPFRLDDLINTINEVLNDSSNKRNNPESYSFRKNLEVI